VLDGAVLIDGQDVRNVKLISLRSSICLVPQDPVLFNATLRDNLLYGKPKASQGELREAAHIAQLDDLIRRLPGGWNEPLGPRGCWLSGGERQRIALARAVLQNPRILLLDEPTSAVDGATEERIWRSLDEFVRDKTTIVISHRPCTIRWIDRVVTIRDGRALEGVCDGEVSQKGVYDVRLTDHTLTAG
jgi:ATP-binding cassette subfamily B protein